MTLKVMMSTWFQSIRKSFYCTRLHTVHTLIKDRYGFVKSNLFMEIRYFPDDFVSYKKISDSILVIKIALNT